MKKIQYDKKREREIDRRVYKLESLPSYLTKAELKHREDDNYEPMKPKTEKKE